MAKAITDFEETRRCLLNTYNSNVQNHAAYIISLIIGASVIISSFDAFLKIEYGFIPFISLIVLILIVSIFMTRRIKYWTNYVSIAIFLPENYAIKLFEEYPPEKKFPYSIEAPAPNTAILEIAISRYLWHLANDKKIAK